MTVDQPCGPGADAEYDADRWWDEARRREGFALIRDSCLTDEEYDAARRRLRSPGWVPERKPPRLPSKWEIASYWAGLGLDDWFWIDIEHPHCFACGMRGALRGESQDAEPDLERRWDAALRLQRGHIVNRARDGLDAVQNLTLLCGFCNKNMPMFGVEDEDAAVGWINSGGAIAELEARIASR